jgi:hypothetical protein
VPMANRMHGCYQNLRMHQMRHKNRTPVPT